MHKHMPHINIHENLLVVVQIATKYLDILSPIKLIGMTKPALAMRGKL